MTFSNLQKLWAEGLGTAFLLATVVGSGIMGESLSGGNVGIALLANTLATGAILYVLISVLGPVSGAHFNPAVTLAFRLEQQISNSLSIGYVLVQIIGGLIGVWAAHAMFDQSIWQISEKIRTGPSQWFSEVIATFGLVFIILGAVRVNKGAVAASVGLYITAAYWFTASTSFANPAVTIARSLSDTFAGVRPVDAPEFILAQISGGILAVVFFRIIFGRSKGPDDPENL